MKGKVRKQNWAEKVTELRCRLAKSQPTQWSTLEQVLTIRVPCIMLKWPGFTAGSASVSMSWQPQKVRPWARQFSAAEADSEATEAWRLCNDRTLCSREAGSSSKEDRSRLHIPISNILFFFKTDIIIIYGSLFFFISFGWFFEYFLDFWMEWHRTHAIQYADNWHPLGSRVPNRRHLGGIQIDGTLEKGCRRSRLRRQPVWSGDW